MSLLDDPSFKSILIFLYCPLLVGPSFQNIFISFLSSPSCRSMFHNIFIFLCCPPLLIDPNVHSIFIIFVVLSFLSLQAFKAFSFFLQIFFSNLLSRLCKDLDHLCLLYCGCLSLTLLPRHDFLFHFEVVKAMQNFIGHQSFSSISNFVLFSFLLLFIFCFSCQNLMILFFCAGSY